MNVNLKIINDIFVIPFRTFKDDRGTISLISENCPIGSVSVIDSVKDSLRAAHFHPRDFHVCMLTDGEMIYYAKPHDSNEKVKKYTIKTGQTFYTPPMTDHLMEFIQPSKFICLSHLPRDEKTYEEETIRLDYDLRLMC